ncbi:hypothetical protein FNF29_05134 [Cafeteria roenbergensis]|uniref:Uncharacterized protein n=1 Tax=Cafeteria roenbergensis TaxID=33653 RepID=A0A5A8CD33_CAFRO|nr:hypothetical protein FNF29_05134 [Cafeteria roenbergensis]|eukprot:KAA0150559.1 hypothetical protein FNF29_05134 [Cafeteria roenbergensis]
MRRCRFLAPSLRGSLRAAFSSDGKRAAVLREGGAIDLWQADAGAASRGDWLRVSVVEVGASAALSCLAWCQPRGGAGETLLAGSMDGSVRHVRWEAGSAPRVASLGGGPVWCLSASPSDRAVLVVGGDDGSARIAVCEAAVGPRGAKALVRLTPGPSCAATDGRVVCASWHPSGAAVVTGTDRGVLRVWETRAGVRGAADEAGGSAASARASCAHRMQVAGVLARRGPGAARLRKRGGAGARAAGAAKEAASQRVVWGVCLTEDWTLGACDSEGVLTLWDARTAVLLQRLAAHTADATAVVACRVAAADSATTDVMLTCGVDGRLVAFRPVTGASAGAAPVWAPVAEDHRHSCDVRALAALPNGALVITGAADGATTIGPLSGVAPGAAPSSAAGDRPAAASGPAARRQDLSLPPVDTPLIGAAVAASAPRLAMADPVAGRTCVWELPQAGQAASAGARPRLLARVATPARSAVRAIALSPCGGLLAIVTDAALTLLLVPAGAAGAGAVSAAMPLDAELGGVVRAIITGGAAGWTAHLLTASGALLEVQVAPDAAGGYGVVALTTGGHAFAWTLADTLRAAHWSGAEGTALGRRARRALSHPDCRAGLVGRRTALADGVSLVVAGGKEVVAATVAVASSKKSKRSRAEAASAPVKVSEAVTETDEVASLDVLEDGSVCVGEVADDVAAALAPPSLRTRQFAV